MGTATIVVTSTSLTKAQWDTFLTALQTFISNHPGLNLSVDKTQSVFQENPP